MMDTVYLVKVTLFEDDPMEHDYDGVYYHSKRLAVETAADALNEYDVLDAWVEELEVKMNYIIVEVDGIIRSCINRKGQADKYSQPKLFGTRKEAQEWIDKHTYKGMSVRYEIEEVKS